MDNVNNIFNKYINKLYNNTTYLDKYGGSVVITGVTLFIFFLIFSYMYVMNRIKPIKADWLNQRCSPAVIPFAGLVNKEPGTSAFEYTATNFQSCLSQILSQIISLFTAPVNALVAAVHEFYAVLVEAIQAIRKLFESIRTKVMSIAANVMHRITNVLIKMQYIFIKLQSIMGKIQGTLTASLFTTLGTYMALQAFFGAFLEILIIFLIILAAAAIIMWIFPFTWEIAIPMTILFVLLAIPMAIIAVGLNELLDLTAPGAIPPNPCFDEHTRIPLKTGDKKISDIQLGDVLKDGGRVTAIFKSSSHNVQIYNLDNIIVTGKHTVFHHEKGWISVAEHPRSRLIECYMKPYVYCLNTTTKKINIQNYVFMDWDEMDELDVQELKNIMKGVFKENPIRKTEDIHSWMESGFGENTQIEIEDGRLLKISELEVNDELRSGDRILGIVKIDSTNVRDIKQYQIQNLTFIGGPNLRIKDKYLGEFSTVAMEGEKVTNIGTLYHIITDTGFLTINGIRFYDYNGSLEQILWNKEQLSKKF